MQIEKRMSSGRYIDLAKLRFDDVDLKDIDTALNYTYRFGGHHKDRPPLTVAQHTLLCVRLAEDLYQDHPDLDRILVATVMHDFGEAYYGDITTGLKLLLGQEFKDLMSHIDRYINLKLWPYPESEPASYIKDAVKVVDLLSLDIERRSMWNSQLGKDKWPPVPKVVGLPLDSKVKVFGDIALQGYVSMVDLYNKVLEHRNVDNYPHAV